MGACEYITTRKGKAKQYCRKKSTRLDALRVARERGRRAVEHAQQVRKRTKHGETLAQERARTLAERKRALKIDKQRVEAEQTLALERARNAAERDRALQIDKRRGEAEKTLAEERLRAQQLADQEAATKQQLSYERARNVAERERAIQLHKELHAPLYKMESNSAWEY